MAEKAAIFGFCCLRWQYTELHAPSPASPVIVWIGCSVWELEGLNFKNDPLKGLSDPQALAEESNTITFKENYKNDHAFKKRDVV